MSTEDNKALVSRWYEEGLNQKKTAAIDEFICNPDLLADPKMLYDGNSPACTRFCKCIQACSSFTELGNSKRYGVS